MVPLYETVFAPHPVNTALRTQMPAVALSPGAPIVKRVEEPSKVSAIKVAEEIAAVATYGAAAPPEGKVIGVPPVEVACT